MKTSSKRSPSATTSAIPRSATPAKTRSPSCSPERAASTTTPRRCGSWSCSRSATRGIRGSIFRARCSRPRPHGSATARPRRRSSKRRRSMRPTRSPTTPTMSTTPSSWGSSVSRNCSDCRSSPKPPPGLTIRQDRSTTPPSAGRCSTSSSICRWPISWRRAGPRSTGWASTRWPVYGRYSTAGTAAGACGWCRTAQPWPRGRSSSRSFSSNGCTAATA